VKEIPAATNFSPRQINESWGWMIAQEKHLAGIDISADEISTFLKGFTDNIDSRPAPCDLRRVYSDVQMLGKERRKKLVQAVISNNAAVASHFFDNLRTQTNIQRLPEDVYVEILKTGGQPSPKPTQTVNIHYTGRLLDGTEFLQMGPTDMVLVSNRDVCRGWTSALQKIGPGGALKLFVPPPLSEQAAELLGIQPGSGMFFEIELIEVKDTSPQDLADALTPLPPVPAPPKSVYTEKQIIEAWGWATAAETHIARYGLSEADLSSLKDGLAAGIQGKSAPYDLREVRPEVERWVDMHERMSRANILKKRHDETDAFFAALKKNTNIVELFDGLRFEILKPGQGPFPKADQRVRVNYTGRLIDGTVFDRTTIGPLEIDLKKVIPGWSEGVQKINKGGSIRLYIPPALGYGSEATSGIPADSALVFEIELLEIEDAPASQ
jgi:FKBP-type peptidyl-prolyl cis-trans isomerase